MKYGKISQVMTENIKPVPREYTNNERKKRMLMRMVIKAEKTKEKLFSKCCRHQEVVLKCGCCGSTDLEIRGLSDLAKFGGIRISVGSFTEQEVNKARLCRECGNIMPFIDKTKI